MDVHAALRGSAAEAATHPIAVCAVIVAPTDATGGPMRRPHRPARRFASPGHRRGRGRPPCRRVGDLASGAPRWRSARRARSRRCIGAGGCAPRRAATSARPGSRASPAGALRPALLAWHVDNEPSWPVFSACTSPSTSGPWSIPYQRLGRGSSRYRLSAPMQTMTTSPEFSEERKEPIGVGPLSGLFAPTPSPTHGGGAGYPAIEHPQLRDIPSVMVSVPGLSA